MRRIAIGCHEGFWLLMEQHVHDGEVFKEYEIQRFKTQKEAVNAVSNFNVRKDPLGRISFREGKGAGKVRWIGPTIIEQGTR